MDAMGPKIVLKNPTKGIRWGIYIVNRSVFKEKLTSYRSGLTGCTANAMSFARECSNHSDVVLFVVCVVLFVVCFL